MKTWSIWALREQVSLLLEEALRWEANYQRTGNRSCLAMSEQKLELARQLESSTDLIVWP